MEYNLMIGGIGFHITSDVILRTADPIERFMPPWLDQYQINIEVFQDLAPEHLPRGPRVGEDILLEYYLEEGMPVCLAKGGWKGPLAVTYCNLSYTHLICHINRELSGSLTDVNTLLRVLPLRTALQLNGVMFFHASQIAVNGKGILFTAPSGTGKTTQAKLWCSHRRARIICNDRTLLYNGQTFGFPVDGSEPVCSSEVYPIGAIVLLSQGRDNQIRCLKPSVAVAKILPQLVIDGWNPEARVLAAQQILELMTKFPVYHLSCTADESAVCCLEYQLKADGVLS